MIVVTGLPRSGTSMWMQILEGAGHPMLGEAFPEVFRRIERANPRGFYESRLRFGINHLTNPDPETGSYIHPAATRSHVVKIFAHGVPATELGFLDAVLLTVRPWRSYCASFRRMWTLGASGDAPRDPLPLIWWSGLYGLVRDAGIRGYPLHAVAYERVIADPDREIAHVLRWLGSEDERAAVREVRPELETRDLPVHELDAQIVTPEMDDLFERFYAGLRDGVLGPGLLADLNAMNVDLARQLPAMAERPD